MNSKEKPTFNDLPDEIILKVFEMCNIVDVPAIRLVCNRWERNINNSLFWRMRFKTSISNQCLTHRHPFVEAVMRGEWNFPRTIKFELVQFDAAFNAKAFLQKLAPELEHINLALSSNIRTEDMPYWFIMLEEAVNLKSLDISSNKYLRVDGVEVKLGLYKFQFNNLARLHIDLGHIDILHNIMTSLQNGVVGLQTFSINHYCSRHVQSVSQMKTLMEPTMKIIKMNVSTLKSLSLNGVRQRELKELTKIENLALEKFTIHNYFKSYEPLYTFLTQQLGLIDLQLLNFNDVYILAVFPEMPNLKNLSVHFKNTGDVILNMEFMNNFPKLEKFDMTPNGYVVYTYNVRPNRNLTSFRLHHRGIISAGEFNVHESMSNAFPNLASLEMHVHTIGDILHISENPSLRSVTLLTREGMIDVRNYIRNESMRFSEILSFEMLDSLTIYDYGKWLINHAVFRFFRLPNCIALSLNSNHRVPSEITDEDLCRFIRLTPALRTLHLEYLSMITNATIHFLANNAMNLETISIRGLPLVTADISKIFADLNRYIYVDTCTQDN